MKSMFITFCALFVVSIESVLSFSLLRSQRSTDDVPVRCLHPPDSGMCLAYFLNYHYNPSSGKCETFVYGGCQGNDNNFWSKLDCETICKVNDNDYDEDDGEYDYSEYALLLSMEALIEGKDACEYPPVTGECRAAFQRYYYNGEKCEEFIYGGCHGNPNNFETEEECIQRCMPMSENENSIEGADETVEDLCSLPSEIGPCRAGKTRYYYNGTKCDIFTYGGCRGNANNFRTEEDCLQACDPNSFNEAEVLVESNSVEQQQSEE